MWRDAITKRIEALEHPAWGPHHCRRLLATCNTIVDREGLDVDHDVLFAIVWLHDIGTFGEFSCEAPTPPECASIGARRLLGETTFPAEKLDLVTRIIAEHSFEGDRRDTVEACVLRDADMLEFLGAIGLVRLLSIVEVEEWVAEPKDAVAMALDFTDQLPDKLFYRTSRLIAEQRREETMSFLEALGSETADMAWL